MGKRALVMSGGSARGAFEAGAADYLIRQRGLDFDVIAGVSVGSLNGAKLAQAKGPAELKKEMEELSDLWLGITGNRNFYRKSFLGDAIILFRNHLYDQSPTRSVIADQVDPERLRQSGREFRLGAVTLESGAYRGVDQRDPQLLEWIFASTATPIAFEPVTIDGAHVVDGGLRNITPLREAFLALEAAGGGNNSDPDEMYVLLSSPLDSEPAWDMKWTAKHVALRSLDILTNEIYREDLLHALHVNASVRAYLGAEEQLREKGWTKPEIDRLLTGFYFKPDWYHPVTILTVAPDKPFLNWFEMEMDPKKIKEAFAAGREASKAPLDEQALLRKLRPGS